MLTMFPRFALVVVWMYLSVFAKVRRPSSTPCRSTARSRFRSTKSAASRATSVAVSTEIAVSAACIAGASLIPSPRKPTTLPRFFSARMIRSFWFGSTSTNRSVPSRRLPERLVLHLVEVVAGEDLPGAEPDLGRDVRRDRVGVAGDQLDLHPERAELGDRLPHALLRRIAEEQEARPG